jgi:hypothetical protein
LIKLVNYLPNTSTKTSCFASTLLSAILPVEGSKIINDRLRSTDIDRVIGSRDDDDSTGWGALVTRAAAGGYSKKLGSAGDQGRTVERQGAA